jgi:LysR family transcriptional activator of mexEF-oprN operon
MANLRDAYGRDLDLNLLRIFAVVVEEGSITRAASRLYVTQPAISVAMRRLTAFVGTDLFVRQGSGIVLTSRGNALARATRAFLGPLVAATIQPPVFDPRTSTAAIKLGLADTFEALILPRLLRELRAEAPAIQVLAIPIQFRTVEEALLTNKVDLALSVADEMPRSILRRQLAFAPRDGGGFVCLYDPRILKLPKTVTEEAYFEREHVVVSYAGDARGIVEDTLGRARKVRVSLSSLSHVADVVDGSDLIATIPQVLARHILKSRPYLRMAALPFTLSGDFSLDMLWLRVTSEDALASFFRDLVARVTISLAEE